MNRAPVPSLALVLFAGALLAPSTGAQGTEILLQEGDVVPIDPPALVEGIWIYAVSDDRLRYSHVSTDLPDDTANGVLLRDGVPYLREGDQIGPAPEDTLQFAKDVSVNAAGHVAWLLQMPNVGFTRNEGLFWNRRLIVQTGNRLGVSPFPDETFSVFGAAKINDRNEILAQARVGQNDVLLRFAPDGQGGFGAPEVLLAERQEFQSFGEIWHLQLAPHTIAMNRRGDWLAKLVIREANSDNEHLVLNGEPVLSEGDPDPTPGSDRTLTGLGLLPVDLNDEGDWLIHVWARAPGEFDHETNRVLIKNGEAFAHRGQSFPGIAPHAIDRFEAAPVFIANSGDVYYYIGTDNPDTSADQAYVRNFRVVLREGQALGGRTVTRLRRSRHGTHVSPSGRYLIGQVDLDGEQALLLFDFGLVLPLPGCHGNPGMLELAAGTASVGQAMTFRMDDGQAFGVVPVLYFSTQPAVPGSRCGRVVAAGELLIGRKVARRLGTPWMGDPVLINVSIPNDPSLVDLELFGQGAFLDVDGTAGSQRVTLTNGVKLEIGPP